jgi:hypothetical protein
LVRIGGEMIKTKYLAIVERVSQGLQVEIAQIDHIYIVVENENQLAGQCSRLISELVDIPTNSFEIEFSYK